jgi:hypothetical protein
MRIASARKYTFFYMRIASARKCVMGEDWRKGFEFENTHPFCESGSIVKYIHEAQVYVSTSSEGHWVVPVHQSATEHHKAKSLFASRISQG